MKVLYLFLFPVILVACGKSKDVAYATRRDLTQAVYASGKLYPKNDYIIIICLKVSSIVSCAVFNINYMKIG